MRTPPQARRPRLGLLTLEDRLVPSNDLFAQAAVVDLATAPVVRGSNVGYTVEPGEPDHGDYPPGFTSRASAWATLTAPAGGALAVAMSGDFPYHVTAYTGPAVDQLV